MPDIYGFYFVIEEIEGMNKVFQSSNITDCLKEIAASDLDPDLYQITVNFRTTRGYGSHSVEYAQLRIEWLDVGHQSVWVVS